MPVAADPSRRDGTPDASETLNVAALRSLLATGADVTVIDVREDWEHAAGAIRGAVHLSLRHILERGVSALPAGRGGGEVVLYCQGGIRSATALERLRPAWSGREGRLRHLDGGYDAWTTAATPHT